MSVRKKIWIIAAGTALVVLAGLIALSFYSVKSFEESKVIASNVTFKGIYIGDITPEEAKERLNASELPLEKPVKITYNDKSFEIAPDAAGITYSLDTVCETAYKIGRSDNFFKALFEIAASRFSFKEIEPVFTTDMEFFENTINTAARAAGIEFDNTEITVFQNCAKVKINKDLRRIDITTLFKDLMAVADTSNKERVVPLFIVAANKVTAKEIYDGIYVKPQDASVEEKDGVTTIIPHTIGVIVNLSDIEKALSEGKTEFTVPVTKKYPEIRTEHFNNTLFKDVLGSYTSKYNASLVGRTRNVTLSANKINGIILNTGDVFSYNNIVGPRTVAAGFSVATVYTNAGLSEEMGGGICQTSSTLYNAVLYADLKIVERKNHMYTVSYVKNGLDATVAYGLIDFKFQNNLNSPIKVVTSVGNGVLTVTLLGIKPNNNRVELYTNTVESYPFTEKEEQKPELSPGEKKVIQNGAYGYKINATKVVKDSAGNILRQDFLGTNVYKPLTKIIHAGLPVPSEPEVINPSEGNLQEEGDIEVPAPEISKEQAAIKPDPAVTEERTDASLEAYDKTTSDKTFGDNENESEKTDREPEAGL